MTRGQARNRLGRRLGAAAAAVALAFGGAVAFAPVQAAAAAHAAPGNAVLTKVSVSASPTGETRVLLTFNQILPQFTIGANDSAKPVLVFSTSGLSPAARVTPGAKGVLTDLGFDQKDGALSVILSGAGPIHVTATPDTTRSLALVITPASPAQVTAAAGPAQPAPSFYDRAVGEDGFVVVPLKYADVSEVVGLLTAGLSVKSNDSFNPQEPAFGSAGMTGTVQAPPVNNGSGQSTDPQGQAVDEAIGIDRRLNAIILHGTPERIARMRAMIAKIDVPVTSVVLETVFVELTETGAKDVGLDFNNTNNQIAVATFQSGQFASQGFGNAKAGFGSYSLQAAIYAQVQKGRGRIISKPRIAAQSGGSAKIITGDALPILTSIALSGVNAVSQQVQYVNVGVTLQIAPRISDDGFVTSHVFCEVSSVTGFSQGYPTISQREASTSATVKDGDSFVIGGLSQDSDIASDSKFPVAGDIPVLGNLFRVRKDTRSKTDLYIVVTPHIVRGDDPQASAILRNAN